MKRENKRNNREASNTVLKNFVWLLPNEDMNALEQNQ